MIRISVKKNVFVCLVIAIIFILSLYQYCENSPEKCFYLDVADRPKVAVSVNYVQKNTSNKLSDHVKWLPDDISPAVPTTIDTLKNLLAKDGRAKTSKMAKMRDSELTRIERVDMEEVQDEEAEREEAKLLGIDKVNDNKSLGYQEDEFIRRDLQKEMDKDELKRSQRRNQLELRHSQQNLGRNRYERVDRTILDPGSMTKQELEEYYEKAVNSSSLFLIAFSNRTHYDGYKTWANRTVDSAVQSANNGPSWRNSSIGGVKTKSNSENGEERYGVTNGPAGGSTDVMDVKSVDGVEVNKNYSGSEFDDLSNDYTVSNMTNSKNESSYESEKEKRTSLSQGQVVIATWHDSEVSSASLSQKSGFPSVNSLREKGKEVNNERKKSIQRGNDSHSGNGTYSRKEGNSIKVEKQETNNSRKSFLTNSWKQIETRKDDKAESKRGTIEDGGAIEVGIENDNEADTNDDVNGDQSGSRSGAGSGDEGEESTSLDRDKTEEGKTNQGSWSGGKLGNFRSKFSGNEEGGKEWRERGVDSGHKMKEYASKTGGIGERDNAENAKSIALGESDQARVGISERDIEGGELEDDTGSVDNEDDDKEEGYDDTEIGDDGERKQKMQGNRGDNETNPTVTHELETTDEFEEGENVTDAGTKSMESQGQNRGEMVQEMAVRLGSTNYTIGEDNDGVRGHVSRPSQEEGYRGEVNGKRKSAHEPKVRGVGKSDDNDRNQSAKKKRHMARNRMVEIKRKRKRKDSKTAHEGKRWLMYHKDVSCLPLDPNLLLFNRIFKTGSTSINKYMRKEWERNIFQLRIGTTEDWYKVGDSYPYPRAIEKFANRSKRRRVYSGHFFFRSKLQIKRPYTYINQVREPLERVLSHYFYMRNSKDRPRARIAEMVASGEFNETLRNCFEKQHRGCESNVMTHFFCGIEDFCSTGSEKAIQRAKYNMLHYYAAIGLTENLDLYLKILKKRLPKYFRISIRHLRKEKSSKRKGSLESVSEDVKAMIKQGNFADYQIYEYAKYIFKKQLEECKISARI